MRFLRLAVLIGMTVLVSVSQTPAPPVAAADPVIRVSVNLVQIDAVVTDSKGRHIAGLGPDDFEVLEDGKPQRITHLSYLDATAGGVRPPVAAPAPVAPRKGSAPEVVAGPSRKPRREDIRRAMVFLVDDIHTSPEDLIQLKPVAMKFVNEQVAPGDLVSVSAVRGGMGFYEQFTSDRAILNAAVESLAKRVGGSSDAVDEAEGASGCLRALMLFDAVMGKLSWAVQSLNELPGRKAIVLFTDGLEIPRQSCPFEAQDMTASMQKLADQSNRSGVAIYAIDSRGLTTNQLSASYNTGGARVTGRGIAAATMALGAHSLALQETSDFLADETGGIFFRNTNGLSEALGKSIDDMSGYYLIGFQPQRNDFETKNGVAVFHKVQVKVRRSGLSVRFGKGFLGTPDKDMSAPVTPAQELARALISPFDTGGIKVRLTPLYAAPTPGPNGERRPTVLRALLSIDGSGLVVSDAADGRKKAVVDVIAAAYRSDNTPISMQSHEYTVSMKPEDVPKLAKGITYQNEIELPKSGAYQIRVAVRDAGAGSMGSANSFVIVPDFNRPHITLSSLMLAGTEGADTRTQAAVREFRAGATIVYVCEIYGAKAGAETEIRLFRDGVKVFDGPIAAVAPLSGARSISVVGRLVLPADLADGDYQVGLVARDPLAPVKQQTTSQWTDLTVVK